MTGTDRFSSNICVVPLGGPSVKRKESTDTFHKVAPSRLWHYEQTESCHEAVPYYLLKGYTALINVDQSRATVTLTECSQVAELETSRTIFEFA